MEIITSAGNGKIKLAAGLLQRKNRDKEGMFLLEGLRNVELVINHSRQDDICCCFVTEAMAEKPRCRELLAKIDTKKIFQINEQLLSKISEAVTPQGIVTVLKQPATDKAALLRGEGPLLILDRVMDPGNIGTIIRTADAMGARGIVALKGSADIYAPKVIRSAMGSIFSVPIWRNVTTEELTLFLDKAKFAVYLADLDENSLPLYEVDLKSGAAVVLGNEANGIGEELKIIYTEKLHIPMVGNAESLNVAMANAMILYEYRRQVMSVDVKLS